MRLSDAAGVAGALIGAILVAVGLTLQEQDVSVGATVRTLGGILLLGGVGVLLFGTSQRRRASNNWARRIIARYMAATERWRWPNRAGVAGVAIGLLLLPPALVAQVLFGTVVATVIIAPGIVVFWVGVAFIIYAWFQRGSASGLGATGNAHGPQGGAGPRGR